MSFQVIVVDVLDAGRDEVINVLGKLRSRSGWIHTAIQHCRVKRRGKSEVEPNVRQGRCKRIE